MSIRKTVAGNIIDKEDAIKDAKVRPSPPPDEDGDIATPKSDPPTEDDKPLE